MTRETETRDADASDIPETFDGHEEAITDSEHVSQPASAGGRLRAARDAKRLDLSHVAAETRIPIRHLEAIEEGRYESLPSRTYAIGFSKNYAQAVDLDREEIADMVRAELAEGNSSRTGSERKIEPGDPAKVPSARLAWFGAIAALLLAVGVVAFYSNYFGAGSGPPPIAAQEEIVEPAIGEAADTADGDLASAQSGPTPDGQVVFTATDEAWVRFYEDGGERYFEAVMDTGDTFEVPADSTRPLINTGRPHLFEITIDGQSVPKLAEEQTILGGVPISASALLARGAGENAGGQTGEPQTDGANTGGSN